NLQLLRQLDRLVTGEILPGEENGRYPLLVGPSRKSFIGLTLDVPVEERLEGTAAVVAWVVARGAQIVRVHDVKQMVRVVRMVEAIKGA
ncbi:MAG: dihydropteroate synthase, partial [Acidimicrobiia bacterium]